MVKFHGLFDTICGEVPKRLKGLASNTSRRVVPVRGFKSPSLRHQPVGIPTGFHFGEKLILTTVDYTFCNTLYLGERSCHLLVFLFTITSVIAVVIERCFLIHVTYYLPYGIEIYTAVEHG